MKKRILCFLLALLMLVSMAPAAAPRAAAVSRSASDNAIAVLKKLEGFHAKAYLDNGRWTIGYGTAAKEGDIITEASGLSWRSSIRQSVSFLLRSDGILPRTSTTRLCCSPTTAAPHG